MDRIFIAFLIGMASGSLLTIAWYYNGKTATSSADVLRESRKASEWRSVRRKQ